MLRNKDLLVSVKDDPVTLLLVKLLRDRLDNIQAPKIHRSELILLGSMFMTDMFAHGVMGEIA